LSYARSDKARIGKLQRVLEANGIPVWRDIQSLQPGQDWKLAIRRAITKDALAFVACFSRTGQSGAASYQNEELLLAIDQFRRHPPDQMWLIPVRLDECELPEYDLGAGRTLASLQSADLFGKTRADHTKRLIEMIAQVVGSKRDVESLPDRSRTAEPVQLATNGLPSMVRGRAAKTIAAVDGPAYLQQVRRIAPPNPPGLQGRDAELVELAAFCTEPDRGPYVWWQAGPWAGKSALLSTFVLRPPPAVADQVTFVSFFITARLAAQDTREAFTQALLDQLAVITGEDLPAILPEASRDVFVLDLLGRAARLCADEGERLVLVVDGLDEDRHATAGPDAHSIAGLLPADPPTGMRVIVSGRPDPPAPVMCRTGTRYATGPSSPIEPVTARLGHRPAGPAGTEAAAERHSCRTGDPGPAYRRPRWPVRQRPG
jgi:hypothetical protein